MIPDPAIDEIRNVRHKISEEFGHDAARHLVFLKQMQETQSGRVIINTDHSKTSIIPQILIPLPVQNSVPHLP